MNEEVTIRHVRLCQCGKPAGHDSVCNRDRGGRDGDEQVERVDLVWEEAEARRREERNAKRRIRLDADRRNRRSAMSSLDLHRHAVARQAKLSSVSAPPVGRSSPNSEIERIGPARQQLLDDDPRWRETSAVIRSRLERWHELLDEAEGLGTVAATTNMLGVEKDKKVIQEGVGLSPLAVVEKLGRDIAGSPETVRRIRRKAERSTRDGTVRLGG